MKRVLVICLVGTVLCAGSAAAEIYKYTDSNGELHFVDDLGKVPKKYRDRLQKDDSAGNVNMVDSGPSAPSRPVEQVEKERPSRQARPVSGGQVEVFLTEWCGYCKKMTRYLNEKGIPYTAYDIEKDQAARRTHRELGGRGVPVVRIGSNVVHGFNPKAVQGYYEAGKGR